VRRDSVAAARWTVSGTAKIAKDVRAAAIGLRGLVTIGGQLSASTVRGRGTLEVQGPIEVGGPLILSGTLRAAVSVHSADFEVTGSVRCAGPLTVDRLCSVDGVLEAAGVTAGILRIKGSAQLSGRVEAGALDAELRETSAFGSIMGHVVQVRGKVPNIVDKALFHERIVTIDRIEAESVRLEGVEAGFVRSPQIVLGRGCHVTQIEGTIVRQHSSSYVGPESRTPPPYGLRR
jgi:cytoskeletal protein CcmA (bactofilin family)